MTEAVIILLIIAVHCVNEILRAAEMLTEIIRAALRSLARKVADRLARTA